MRQLSEEKEMEKQRYEGGGGHRGQLHGFRKGDGRGAHHQPQKAGAGCGAGVRPKHPSLGSSFVTSPVPQPLPTGC